MAGRDALVRAIAAAMKDEQFDYAYSLAQTAMATIPGDLQLQVVAAKAASNASKVSLVSLLLC
jgi:hypothetical protein